MTYDEDEDMEREVVEIPNLPPTAKPRRCRGREETNPGTDVEASSKCARPASVQTAPEVAMGPTAVRSTPPTEGDPEVRLVGDFFC